MAVSFRPGRHIALAPTEGQILLLDFDGPYPFCTLSIEMTVVKPYVTTIQFFYEPGSTMKLLLDKVKMLAPTVPLHHTL
jgi:hypothetical protein